MEEENKTGCRSFLSHDANFYKPKYRKRMSLLTNLICSYHNAYYNWSAHIFHRELAEALDRVIEKQTKLWTNKHIKRH